MSRLLSRNNSDLRSRIDDLIRATEGMPVVAGHELQNKKVKSCVENVISTIQKQGQEEDGLGTIIRKLNDALSNGRGNALLIYCYAYIVRACIRTKDEPAVMRILEKHPDMVNSARGLLGQAVKVPILRERRDSVTEIVPLPKDGPWTNVLCDGDLLLKQMAQSGAKGY